MSLIDIINEFMDMIVKSDEIKEYFTNIDALDFKPKYAENTPSGEKLIHIILYDSMNAWYAVIITKDNSIVGYEFVEEARDPGIHLFP